MNIINIEKLTVEYNGRTVGYLAELKSGKIGFQYAAEWVESGFSVSPISLPLSNELYVSEKSNFQGLFGVFWDSLPDGWGELLVRRMLWGHGISYEKLSPLQKLSIISENGLGALEYKPSVASNAEVNMADPDELAREAAKILNDETDGVDLDSIFYLGGSSGGARPKAHICQNGEDWIIKFPCAIDPPDAGEKEFAANALARECGISVNEFALFGSKVCSGYFGAKRFDRIGNKKRHVISLSALLETSHRIPNLDYGHLFQVISLISADREADLYEAFLRMCFNVIYKNRDDHGKNFAFIYDEGSGGYRLSPAYDLTQTATKPEHEMTVNGSGVPTERDILALARDFCLSKKKCEEMLSMVKKKVENE